MKKQTTGEFLAALRKANGLTQQEVAEKLNISDRTLSSWETGRTAPDLLSLPELADLYGVTVDEILRGEKRQPVQNNSFAEEPETQVSEFEERFTKFNRRRVQFIALAVLCALTVFVGCIIMLYSTAPVWLDVLLIFAGATGNAVFIAGIFKCETLALSDIDESEKAYALTVRHKMATAVILNSLAYFLGAIIILICEYTVSIWSTDVSGAIWYIYEANVAIAISVCIVLGVALLISGILYNVIHLNCSGSTAQKAAAKSNKKLLRKLALFGIIPVALCFIPYIVLSHVIVTAVERTYFTANGVDEVYRYFQTLTLDTDRVLTNWQHNNTRDVTIIPAGKYYLDFQSETYVVASDSYGSFPLPPEPRKFYDIGNNFYAWFGNNDKCLADVADLGGDAMIYYLKEGVKIEDIDPEKDYENYFAYYGHEEVIDFTSPDGEKLSAVNLHYYSNHDGWYYYCGNYCYHYTDELVLSRDGDVYTYQLIGYYDYSPVGLYTLLGAAGATILICSVVYLFKRKKIKYAF